MYRIMLVDDEPLILAGISSLIPWEEHDCTIVGKATNGTAACKMILELQPDIIITDIKMPVMNGLELIQKCKDEKLVFSFIVLTNLEEFELAKEALSLSASDYLVKIDLTEETLLRSLEKAKNDFDNMAASRSGKIASQFMEAGNEEIIKGFFNRLLFSPFDAAKDHSRNMKMDELFVSPLLILLDISYSDASYLSENKKSDLKQVMTYASGIISEMAGRIFKNSCILPFEQQKLLIIASTEGLASIPGTLTQFNEKVNEVLKNYFEISVVMGVSEAAEDLYDLKTQLDQAKEAVEYYYCNPSSSISFYSSLPKTCSSRDNFNINFLKKDLSIAFQQNNSEKVKEIFDELIGLLETYTPSRKQAVNSYINLYTYIHSYFESDDQPATDIFPDTLSIMEHINQINSIEALTKYMRSFQQILCDYLDSRKTTRTDKIIELVKSYINNHYKEKLTLSDVANALNFSAGYISSSFKKHTGYNFSDYISFVKIEKAKELIDTHEYLMYEISEMLGFDNPYYFSKVFKKITGISPREYELNNLK
ncbi:response regulator transcription factor [Anaerobium acetethylicum]|uniref:Stage 0 sporulation protein A homolog n=1 Tax=Anaerobium acetethylicum TaxID=1619234 RepID=A0A1D3TU96_9FIRM|nr:response regulator [Anaerobium acetethylicum]SCP97628.1 two-component system, response regulator YesN [Anaerobium acetethylicum]